MDKILKQIKNNKGYVDHITIVIAIIFIIVSVGVFFQVTKLMNKEYQTVNKSINDSINQIDTMKTDDENNINNKNYKTKNNDINTTIEPKEISSESKEKMKEDIRTELKQEIKKENNITEEKHNVFYDINIQVIGGIIGTIIISIFLYVWRKLIKNKINEN